MKLYLNTYLPILEEKGDKESKITFPYDLSGECDFSLDEKNQGLWLQLLQGEAIEKETLGVAFTEEKVKLWQQKRILIVTPNDNESIQSRLRSYYQIQGIPDQSNILSTKKVLLLGCGGIGSHVAWNLAAMGVGTLILVDSDKVEISNLNRQILYNCEDVGVEKAVALSRRIKNINDQINVLPIVKFINSRDDLQEIIKETEPDCIVKALDQPIYIADWVDQVCRNFKIPYTSGQMLGSDTLIGPFYLGDGTASFQDFMEFNHCVEKISGLAPSISFQFARASSLISEDIFKFLIGRDDINCKNTALVERSLKQTIDVYTVPQYPRDRIKNSSISLNGVLFILIIFYLASVLHLPFLWVGLTALCLSIFLPVFISRSAHEAARHSAIWVCASALIFCLQLFLANPVFRQSSVNIFAFISIILTILSVLILIGVGLSRTLFSLYFRLRQWHLHRKQIKQARHAASSANNKDLRRLEREFTNKQSENVFSGEF